MAHLAWVISDGSVDNDLDLPIGDVAIGTVLGPGLRRRGRHHPEGSDSDDQSEYTPDNQPRWVLVFQKSTHSIKNIHLHPACPATPLISSSPTARKLVTMLAR